ncbi:putative membrane protein, partial [Yersinia pestis PY-103]
MDNIDL